MAGAELGVAQPGQSSRHVGGRTHVQIVSPGEAPILRDRFAMGDENVSLYEST